MGISDTEGRSRTLVYGSHFFYSLSSARLSLTLGNCVSPLGVLWPHKQEVGVAVGKSQFPISKMGIITPVFSPRMNVIDINHPQVQEGEKEVATVKTIHLTVHIDNNIKRNSRTFHLHLLHYVLLFYLKYFNKFFKEIKNTLKICIKGGWTIIDQNN